MNLKQAYELFMLSREEYCADSTIMHYRNTLRYFMEYMVSVRGVSAEHISIETISKSDLQGYTLYMRSRPKFEHHRFHSSDSLGITNRSIRTYQIDVRTFFNYLYDEEIVGENIVRRYKIMKAETRQIVPLSSADVALIDSLYSDKTERSYRNLCIVHLMLDAGLRHSEVINLRLCDLDFKQNYIFVRNGKGNKDRIVPLVPRLKKYLYTYIIMYRPDVVHDYVLCTLDCGNQLSRNGIKSLFSRMRSHTKLKRLYPHLLRHTFATAYIMQGGDLESLRLYMGHADISTTQNYLHIAEQLRFNSNVYKLDLKMFRHC